MLMHLFENANKRRTLSLEINAHARQKKDEEETSIRGLLCHIRLQKTHARRERERKKLLKKNESLS